MEDLIKHKNRFVLSIKTNPIIEEITKEVWNGRDSEDLCEWETETTKKINGTKIIVEILVPNEKEIALKKEAIEKINQICQEACIGEYNRHIPISYTKTLYCEFEIEEEYDVPPLQNKVMIHKGIRGSYPVPMYYNIGFDIHGDLWSSELKEEEYDKNLLGLAIAALEELEERIDERYI
jgi:hypothetical protein